MIVYAKITLILNEKINSKGYKFMFIDIPIDAPLIERVYNF